MDKCPICGASVNRYVRKCWFCGNDLPQTRIPSLFQDERSRKRVREASSRNEQEAKIHKPAPETRVCPACREKSLCDVLQSNEWECLNTKCESHKKKLFDGVEAFLKENGVKSHEQAESQVAESTVRSEVKKEKIPESEERGTKDVSEIASKEDQIFRNILYKGHPPYCICVECSKGGLTEKKASGGITKMKRFFRSISRDTKGHTPGIIRMVLASLASVLVVFFFTIEGGVIFGLHSLFFILSAVPLGVLGGVFGVWKRRLGGGMMLAASILLILPAFLGGLWGLLALLTLVGCGISARWHSYD